MVVFSAGQFEASEDMVIACAVRNVDGSWQKTRVLLDRFEMDGETYIPWCPSILLADDGDLHLFFMGNALSGYEFDPQPHSTMFACWLQLDDNAIRMFHARVHDLACGPPRLLLPDDRRINVQGRPLQLPGGEWVVPIDDMGTRHSHFVVFDRKLERYEKRGDLYADPGVLEPSLVRLPDGGILCYVRFFPPWNWNKVPIGLEQHGYIFRATSSDECRTWSTPIETELPNPNSGIDINLGRSGRLLLAYNSSHALRLPLCVGISDDLGRTFRVRDVETGLTDPRYTWRFGNYEINCHCYPKLHQTKDGIWHLFYSHRYDCIKHVWFEESWLEGGRKVFGLAT